MVTPSVPHTPHETLHWRAPASSPIPGLVLHADPEDGALLAIHILRRPPRLPSRRVPARCRPAVAALQAYLTGQARDIPVAYRLPDNLPPVHRAALEALASVSYGELVTYGELAARIGHPRAVRAVGTAMARNPLPLVLPCHRVVAAGGGLGGYGPGTDLKAALLALERRAC